MIKWFWWRIRDVDEDRRISCLKNQILRKSQWPNIVKREKERKNDTFGGNPATLEVRVAGFPPKRLFFVFFSHFALIGPCDFLKIWFLRHDIRRSSSTSRIHCRNHSIIVADSEIANRPTKKAHFLPNRSRNRPDRCCRPISGNQCLNFHRHPTSNNMWIHRWSSQEEFQKTRRGPRLFKRLATN